MDAAPRWPDRGTRVSGRPEIELVVGEDGSVNEARIVRSSFEPPWPEAEAAVISAIKQWKYEPAVFDGKPVPVCLTVVVAVQ